MFVRSLCYACLMDLSLLSKEELIARLRLLESAAMSAINENEDHNWDGDESTWDGYHQFVMEHGGDGYYEPHEESLSCSCGQWGVGWVQKDPQMSDRLNYTDALIEWDAHVTKTLYGEEIEGEDLFDADFEPPF